MREQCVACNQRARRHTVVPGAPRCPVCWQPVRNFHDFGRAHERLDQAVRDWLIGAPLYQVRTNAAKVDPTDPAYSTTPMSVLTLPDAIEAIRGAVNRDSGQFPCPDVLMLVPSRESTWEFENLSFANVSTNLPKGYSDVLIRERERYRHQTDNNPEVKVDVGSVNQSPSGDVVVIWRISN